VLGNNRASLRANPPTKEHIRAWVSICLNDYKDYAILAVALNDEQNTELGSIFTELGFKMVSEGLNSHHTSRVYLYTFCNTVFFSHEENYDEEYLSEEEENF
jgi:hypothetical protein